jgi:hypothetical protein
VHKMKDSTPTSPSAALSLIDLRRHMIRRASILGTRARALRARGDTAQAHRLADESARIMRIAREMGDRQQTQRTKQQQRGQR